MDFLIFIFPNEHLFQVILVFLNSRYNLHFGSAGSPISATLTAEKTATTKMASVENDPDLERVLPVIVLFVDELMKDEEIETRESIPPFFYRLK